MDPLTKEVYANCFILEEVLWDLGHPGHSNKAAVRAACERLGARFNMDGMLLYYN